MDQPVTIQTEMVQQWMRTGDSRMLCVIAPQMSKDEAVKAAIKFRPDIDWRGMFDALEAARILYFQAEK